MQLHETMDDSFMAALTFPCGEITDGDIYLANK